MSLDLWISLVVLFGLGGLTPGPAVGLVLASAFRYGFRPALLPALGVASANVIWLCLAATGAAALLDGFPNALLSLKIIGLLVILYLAISIIFGPLPDANKSAADAPPQSKLYIRGIILQLSSPMPLVYFGLLLPAFFVADKPLLPQLSLMLITVTITELLGLSAYAYGAGKIRNWLSEPRLAKAFNIIIGILMILSGIWAIWSTI
jgi:threonine/homoserine/homoserine lactone efflux protein